MTRRLCQLPGPADPRPPLRPVAERRADFDEAGPGFTQDSAREAAGACLAANTCLWCEVCQLLCPDLCITRDPDSGEIRIDLDHCKGCGLCAHYCPRGAISMEMEAGG